MRTTSPTSSRVRTSRARSSRVAQFHQCDGPVKSWACSVKSLARFIPRGGLCFAPGNPQEEGRHRAPKASFCVRKTGSRYTKGHGWRECRGGAAVSRLAEVD